MVVTWILELRVHCGEKRQWRQRQPRAIKRTKKPILAETNCCHKTGSSNKICILILDHIESIGWMDSPVGAENKIKRRQQQRTKWKKIISSAVVWLFKREEERDFSAYRIEYIIKLTVWHMYWWSIESLDMRAMPFSARICVSPMKALYLFQNSNLIPCDWAWDMPFKSIFFALLVIWADVRSQQNHLSLYGNSSAKEKKKLHDRIPNASKLRLGEEIQWFIDATLQPKSRKSFASRSCSINQNYSFFET